MFFFINVFSWMSMFLFLTTSSSYTPTNYTQQHPSVNTASYLLTRVIYCPLNDCIVYQFKNQRNCLYWKRTISNQNGIRFCYGNNTLLTFAMEFSPDGKYFVVGCNSSNLYVWQFNNGQLVYLQPKYSYSTNITFNASPMPMFISNAYSIAVGINNSLLIFNIPTEGSILQLNHTYNFTNDTQYMGQLKWHPIDVDNLFAYTFGKLTTQSYLWIIDTVNHNMTKIITMEIKSFVIFNSGKYVIVSKRNNTSDIDLYQYLQGNLTFVQSIVPGYQPISIKISKDDRLLSTGYFHGLKVYRILSSEEYKHQQKSIRYQQANIQKYSDISIEEQLLAQQIIDISMTSDTYTFAFSPDGNQFLFTYNNSSPNFKRYSLCTDGTYYNNFTCINCSNQCLTCYQSSNLCRTCNTDSYFQDMTCNKCSLKIDGCNKCQNSTHCDQCNQNSGFIPTPNKFFKCQMCNKTVIGCSKCNSDTKCSKCSKCSEISHFKPDPNQNGTCDCQIDCYLNTTLKHCIKCSTLQNGCNKCVQNGECTGCTQNFIINETSHQCLCVGDYQTDDTGQCIPKKTNGNDNPNLILIICISLGLLIVILGGIVAYCYYKKKRENNKKQKASLLEQQKSQKQQNYQKKDKQNYHSVLSYKTKNQNISDQILASIVHNQVQDRLLSENKNSINKSENKNLQKYFAKRNNLTNENVFENNI